MLHTYRQAFRLYRVYRIEYPHQQIAGTNYFWWNRYYIVKSLALSDQKRSSLR